MLAACGTTSDGECGLLGPATDACAITCEYDGMTVKVGATVPAVDGCNTCACNDDGSMSCTKKACGVVCGGLSGETCDKGWYCDVSGKSCGANDQGGSCAKPPEACDTIYLPVCGCDGKTYGNACEAAAAGMSVRDEGACSDGGVAGCMFGDTSFAVGESVVCPDGCNHCSCSADGSWASTLIGCEPMKAELCDLPVQSDPELSVSPIYVEGDALALEAKYSGGCVTHTFKLCYSDVFKESLPVQADAWLVETTPQADACEALVTTQLVFDLSALRVRYQEAYQTTTGELVVNLPKTQSVTYSF